MNDVRRDLKDVRDATDEDVQEAKEDIRKWKADIGHTQWWIEKYAVHQEQRAYDDAITVYQNAFDRSGVGWDEEKTAWSNPCIAREVAFRAKKEREGTL